VDCSVSGRDGGVFKKNGKGSRRDEVALRQIAEVLEEMVGFLGEMMWVPGEMMCFLEAWGVLREIWIMGKDIIRQIALLYR